MTLLTLINEAQSLLNLPVTTTVVSHTGDTQRQLLQLAIAEGRSLARAHTWQNLLSETTFTTTATEEQTHASADLPADFGWIVPETMWNRTTTEPVRGPLSSRDWQYQKASGTIVADPQFRIRANSFYFLPAPTASQTCAYEYVSKYWCESSGGTDQEKWLADTDVGRIDEYLMTLGVIWRWNRAKGHAYDQDWQDYQAEKSRVIARDGSRKTLSVVGPSRRSLGVGRISEGSWS